MAILTTAGRIAMAMAIANEPIHLGWGSGDPAWDVTPEPEDIADTALVNEIGRRTITALEYCLPDVGGEIEVPNGRFTVSPTPTNYLYMRFRFDFADASSSTIREIGIFMNTAIGSGLPPGQMYFLPEEIQDSGRLLAVERIPALIRSASVRETFEFVLTI